MNELMDEWMSGCW